MMVCLMRVLMRCSVLLCLVSYRRLIAVMNVLVVWRLRLLMLSTEDLDEY